MRKNSIGLLADKNFRIEMGRPIPFLRCASFSQSLILPPLRFGRKLI